MTSQLEKNLPLKAIFKNYQFFEIFILGIFSGMPLAILFTTIAASLSDAKVDLALITSFTLTRTPYTLKFLWAPLVDYFSIPFLNKFGHRKSWLIICSCGIALILIIMSQCSFSTQLNQLFYLALTLGFLSATFDINYDALRIDKLNEENQSIGAALAVFGYRIGMLIAGAGALSLAHFNGWEITYLSLGILYLISILFIINVKENLKVIQHYKNNISEEFARMIIDPFKDFFQRDKALIILLAILFYKLADVMLGAVATPFYIEIGFTKLQIGSITKVFGLFATILGLISGGMVMYKIGSLKGLIICGVLQSVVNLTFIWLHHEGNNPLVLILVILIENFCWGMGSAALVGYISSLCNKQFTATQYALLSSCTNLLNNYFSSYAGSLIKVMGWDNFFAFTVILAIPGLILLIYLQKHFDQNSLFK